ncbi:MAG: AraC family transcriptional regulator, partial [Verrucomicrobiota bacterium]
IEFNSSRENRTQLLEAGEALYLAPYTHITSQTKTPFRLVGICVPPNQVDIFVKSPNEEDMKPGPCTITFEDFWPPLVRLQKYIEELANTTWAIDPDTACTLLARVVVQAACAIMNQPASRQDHKLPKSRQVFETAKIWMVENCQEAVSCGEIAKHAGVDATYLSRLSKKYCGLSIKFLHTYYRMAYARKLLMDDTIRLDEVARQCGYKSKVYFIEAFREMNGIPPLQYRKLYFKNIKTRDDWLRLCHIKSFEMLEPLAPDWPPPPEGAEYMNPRCLSVVLCNMSSRTVQVHHLDENGTPHEFSRVDPCKRFYVFTPKYRHWLFADLNGAPLKRFETGGPRCIGVLTDE